MLEQEIRERLYALQDTAYRDFQAKLIPNVGKERFIGVRTPALRALAKEYAKREEVGLFLSALPHETFDENQLHAFIISREKDYARCLEEVNAFLPYVDNWATCDQLSPKVFQKHRQELLTPIRAWLASDHTYTVRFAIGMLMQHYLDGDFDVAYPEAVCRIPTEEYYVRMMVAWYFATALAKQYDRILPYIEQRRLDKATHNKAIQKALESYRITPEQKNYLKSLKIK